VIIGRSGVRGALKVMGGGLGGEGAAERRRCYLSAPDLGGSMLTRILQQNIGPFLHNERRLGPLTLIVDGAGEAGSGKTSIVGVPNTLWAFCFRPSDLTAKVPLDSVTRFSGLTTQRREIDVTLFSTAPPSHTSASPRTTRRRGAAAAGSLRSRSASTASPYFTAWATASTSPPTTTAPP
jgi:hypothetical protein